MKFIKKYLGLVLGIMSLILFKIFTLLPGFLEAFYTNAVYRLIRIIYSYSLAYIPFPLLYLFIAVIIFLMVNFFRRKRSMASKLVSLLNFIGWLLVAFYWLWGFNYARSNFAHRVQLKVEKPNAEFLLNELLQVDSMLQTIRVQIQQVDTIALNDVHLPKDYHSLIMQSQANLLNNLKQPIFRKPRIRNLKPNGSLLRLKTAGVYFPFVLEGHIDNGLHPIEKPYVMAHELAHANAFTDEGVCNFIGFITCVNSDDPFIQYSGWLEYHGYLYRELRRNFPERLKEIAYRTPQIVKTDISAIRERLDLYPSIAPQLRDIFYNNYLKAQGIKAGMESYSQITMLAYSYKLKHGSFIVE